MVGGYKNMINNMSIADRYAAARRLAHVHRSLRSIFRPVVPTWAISATRSPRSIRIFAISSRGEGACHEDAFVKHADAPRGYDAMIRVAKAMALTAYDLQAEPELLKAAKAEFAERKES